MPSTYHKRGCAIINGGASSSTGRSHVCNCGVASDARQAQDILSRIAEGARTGEFTDIETALEVAGDEVKGRPDNHKDGYIGYSDSEMLELVMDYGYGTIILHDSLTCGFHMKHRATSTVWDDMLNDAMRLVRCKECHG